MNNLGMVHVVIGILRNENRLFFIAKRPPQVVMPDYWEFPGGKIEAHENQLEALQREFAEEVGIQIQTASYLKTFNHQFVDRQIELNVWRIHTYDGQACGNEGQEVRWVDFEQFADFNFLPSNVDVLAFIKQQIIAHD